jgi:Ni,Fe-hydrogenase III small subunit
MREALERTYRATPDPKWVVALGDCAADGGIFSDSYAVTGGVSTATPLPVGFPTWCQSTCTFADARVPQPKF